MKRTRISAIDVGTSKVCAIMADINGTGTLRILGVGVAASQGIERNTLTNTRQAAASIAQAVKKAERMAGYRLKSAYIGVSDTYMSSLNNCGVISVSRDDQMVHIADRKRALDVAQRIDIPGGQRLLHIIPRSYTLDEQDNIKDPVGMCGFRLGVETHIVTTAATSIQNLTKCIMHLGMAVDGLVLDSLCSAEAVLSEDEKYNGVVLADIGGAVTDIAVFKDGSVCHTATLPVGGQNVTNDIAVGLGLPFDLAEEMKKKHGHAITPQDSNDINPVEVGEGILYHDLCDIINARAEELLRLILFQLPQADYTRYVPSGLVLTGGCSNLPGIADLGSQVSGLPVRVGIPNIPSSDSDSMCKPEYATSVGLVYWKINNQGGAPDLAGQRSGLRILPRRLVSYLASRN